MPNKKYSLKIAAYVLRGLFALLIIGVVGLLAFRIIDSKIVPSKVKTLTPNEKLCEVYEEYGNKLTLYRQDQGKYTREEKNYGYFANEGAIFIKEANQLQVIMSYNNSTLKHTKEDYFLPEVPSRDDEVYAVSLRIMYDLTPDNKDDNDGSVENAVRFERIMPAGDAISHKKTLYNYRKFIFDDVVIDDSVIAVILDVHYVGDVDYDMDAYGSICLYHYEEENIQSKLSRADKNALKNYSK